MLDSKRVVPRKIRFIGKQNVGEFANVQNYESCFTVSTTQKKKYGFRYKVVTMFLHEISVLRKNNNEKYNFGTCILRTLIVHISMAKEFGTNVNFAVPEIFLRNAGVIYFAKY